jgi:hypothetical protein
MSEFMHEDDEEERQVLHYVPCDGGVKSGAALNFINRNQEPPPMQKHIDSEESK